MNQQINLRLNEKMTIAAKSYAEEHGFATVQEFIKETVRQTLFPDISVKELELVKRLVMISKDKKLFGTEEELFRTLRKK